MKWDVNTKTASLVLAAIALGFFAMGCNATNVGILPQFASANATYVPGAPSSITLSWNASSNAAGYYIQQSTDGVNFTQVQQVTSGVTTSITGVTPGTTYYFRIQAYNSGGASGYSGVVSATP